MSTIVGNGVSGHADGRADAIPLTAAAGLAFDSKGNLFFIDGFYLRKMSTYGIVTSVAGAGNGSDQVVNGPALQASFNMAGGITMD